MEKQTCLRCRIKQCAGLNGIIRGKFTTECGTKRPNDCNDYSRCKMRNTATTTTITTSNSRGKTSGIWIRPIIAFPSFTTSRSNGATFCITTFTWRARWLIPKRETNPTPKSTWQRPASPSTPQTIFRQIRRQQVASEPRRYRRQTNRRASGRVRQTRQPARARQPRPRRFSSSRRVRASLTISDPIVRYSRLPCWILMKFSLVCHSSWRDIQGFGFKFNVAAPRHPTFSKWSEPTFRIATKFATETLAAAKICSEKHSKNNIFSVCQPNSKIAVLHRRQQNHFNYT